MIRLGTKYKVLLRLGKDKWVVYKTGIESMEDAVQYLKDCFNCIIVKECLPLTAVSIELDE